MVIGSLNDFLSSETRKKLFLYYVFSEISPSDLVEETKIPFSTVDRITQLLKAHNILAESKGRDMRENKYKVNFDFWVEQNLKSMGLGFLDSSEIEEITSLMKDKTFFTLSCLFINSDFILNFFREPLQIGDDIPFLILMDMNEINNKPAQLPSYILVYLEFSPLFKKLAKDIENNLLDNDVTIINKAIKKYTPVKDMTIDKDELLKYEKKRTELMILMRRIFEKKLLKMSVKKTDEIET